MKICSCGETQIKASKNYIGPKWYLIMMKDKSQRGVKFEFTMKGSTDPIKTKEPKVFVCKHCKEEIIMTEHVACCEEIVK